MSTCELFESLLCSIGPDVQQLRHPHLAFTLQYLIRLYCLPLSDLIHLPPPRNALWAASGEVSSKG